MRQSSRFEERFVLSQTPIDRRWYLTPEEDLVRAGLVVRAAAQTVVVDGVADGHMQVPGVTLGKIQILLHPDDAKDGLGDPVLSLNTAVALRQEGHDEAVLAVDQVTEMGEKLRSEIGTVVRQNRFRWTKHANPMKNEVDGGVKGVDLLHRHRLGIAAETVIVSGYVPVAIRGDRKSADMVDGHGLVAARGTE